MSDRERVWHVPRPFPYSGISRSFNFTRACLALRFIFVIRKEIIARNKEILGALIAIDYHPTRLTRFSRIRTKKIPVSQKRLYRYVLKTSYSCAQLLYQKKISCIKADSPVSELIRPVSMIEWHCFFPPDRRHLVTCITVPVSYSPVSLLSVSTFSCIIIPVFPL